MTARDSAGIRIIQPLAAPPDTILADEPFLTIGRTSKDAASPETFQGITDVHVLSDNRFLVLDQRGVRIAVYGLDGSWQFDIGRLGTRPGQFVAPRNVTVHEDTVFVWDDALQRLMAFTDQGQFVRSISIPARSGPLHFAAVTGGFIEAVESGQRQEPGAARAALIRWSENEQRVDTIAGPYPIPGFAWQLGGIVFGRTRSARSPSRRGTTPSDGVIRYPLALSPPVFSQRYPWTAARDRVILALPESPVVEVRDATGALRMLLRLRNQPDTVTALDREAYFQSHLRYASVFSDGYEEQIRREVVFATVRPAVTAIVIDDRGRIWLSDFDPAAVHQNFVSSEWNVFGDDGEPLARVRFPDFFQLLRVQDDLAWGRLLRNDRFERNETVQVYRLHWR